MMFHLVVNQDYYEKTRPDIKKVVRWIAESIYKREEELFL